MLQYLFPYEQVEKDSCVVIYGAGRVGQDYWSQINLSGYCKVIAFLDINYLQFTDFVIPVYAPESITEFDFSKVIIAIENVQIAENVKNFLLQEGVDSQDIICGVKTVQQDNLCIQDRRNNKGELLKIAFCGNIGLGDNLIDILFIMEFYKRLQEKVIIDYYGKLQRTMVFPFITNIYDIKKERLHKEDYDMIITSHRYWLINHCDIGRIKHNEFLYKFYRSTLDLEEMGVYKENGLFARYALLKNKNRIEQTDILDLIPIKREMHGFVPWIDGSEGVLKRYGLCGRRYILFSRAVNVMYDNNNPKLWPLEYYNILAEQIKNEYPDVVLIQVGTDDHFGNIEKMDINLKGKTTYGELCVLLKHALLLISCEGGLVHLQHFLHGRSMVFFGPTSVEEFGYSENINLCYRSCATDCVWLTKKWEEKCILDKDAECMKNISPEIAFSKLEAYISGNVRKKKRVEYVEEGQKNISDIVETLDATSVYVVGKGKNEIEFKREVFYIEDTIIGYENNQKCINFGHCFNLPLDESSCECVIVLRTISSEEEYVLEEEMKRVLKIGGVFVFNDTGRICRIGKIKA